MGESRADQLTELARRVLRLRPSHRDPEEFHVEKSEIANELRRLARGDERGERGSAHRAGGRAWRARIRGDTPPGHR